MAVDLLGVAFRLVEDVQLLLVPEEHLDDDGDKVKRLSAKQKKESHTIIAETRVEPTCSMLPAD